MYIRRAIAIGTVFALALTGKAFGQAAGQADIFAYPEKGQSPEQQQKDKSECHAWAVQTVGFDPARVPQQQAAAPQSSGGGAGRGAVGGAAGGAAVGAIAGSAGKGAAIGGLIGGIHGSRKERAEEQQEQQASNQATEQQQQMQAQFNRAYTACLDGRGYTVK